MEYETFNSIQTKQEMLNHIKNIKYLVIYPDKTRHFYKSLREIGKNICIDSSTISKKMQETDSCICISRGSGFVFWIKKIN
tara:strand:+ start:456 stop:698 length:243 start_codon:yes stop_codon:yes gene_type:complete